MTDTATYLREAREHRGLTLDDVAEATRIPRHYLDMMEGAGDNRLISDRLYLVHYVRQYAAHLQIDEVEQLAAQFIRENNRLQSSQRNPPTQQQRKPRRLVAWLLLLCLVAGAGTAYLYDPNLLTGILPADSPKNPTPVDSMKAEPEPATPSAPVATTVDTTQTQPAATPKEAVTVLQPEAEEIVPLQPVLPEQESDPVTQIASSAAVAPPDAEVSAGGSGPADATEPAPTSPNGQRLEIVATETSWVRVIVDGQRPQDAMMQPGDSRAWSAEKQFVLTFGNAGGVDLILNGKKLAPLGASGQVIRNYQLPKP